MSALMRSIRPLLIVAGLLLLGKVMERRGLSPYGRCLGIPYDLRPPTPERVRTSVWNPADPHLLTPIAFGVGFGINFAAVLRRLGML